MKHIDYNAPIRRTTLLQFSLIERGEEPTPIFHYRKHSGRMNRANGKDRHNGGLSASLVPKQTAPTRRKSK